MCVCVCVYKKHSGVERTERKNSSIKPQGVKSSPHLPPLEKVNLLNINSGSGHHADYATITILHTSSMDPLHHTHLTYTHFLLYPSSHVHLELKPTPVGQQKEAVTATLPYDHHVI